MRTPEGTIPSAEGPYNTSDKTDLEHLEARETGNGDQFPSSSSSDAYPFPSSSMKPWRRMVVLTSLSAPESFHSSQSGLCTRVAGEHNLGRHQHDIKFSKGAYTYRSWPSLSSASISTKLAADQTARSVSEGTPLSSPSLHTEATTESISSPETSPMLGEAHLVESDDLLCRDLHRKTSIKDK